MNLRDKLKFWIMLSNYVDMIVRNVSPLSLPDAVANSLSYVKAFGGTEQRNLPSGYTQLEYIETTGTQYINTGITPTINAKAEVKFAPVATNQVGYWGSRSDPYRFCCTTFNSGTRLGVGMTNNTWPENRTVIVLGSIYDCIIANGYASINGTEYVETPVTDFATTRTFGLGVVHPGGVAEFSKARYYKCKLWENNVLVFDGIPAKNSNNVIGMYDTVSGTFLTNAGTGTFTAGPTAVPTPDAPIDIVSNNGVLKVNTNLYSTEYHDNVLSQADGVTTVFSNGINVSGMVDCRTIKSFKITTISPRGAYRIFKYRADNTFINAATTASVGDIVTLEDNVGFFRIQYNYTSAGVNTEDVLIYDSAHNLGIYTDGAVETINVHGKNLFDISQSSTTQTISGGIWTRYNVPISLSNGAWTCKYMPNISAGTYTLSANSNWNRVVFFDGETATVIALSTSPATFTLPRTGEVWIFCASPSAMELITEAQLEQGTTATAYQPYFDGGTATAEMLLKVGDYQDVQSIIDGVVTRNVGVKVLDGTENWVVFSGLRGVYQVAGRFPTDVALIPNEYIGFCSHFSVIAISASISSRILNGQMGWNTSGYLTMKNESYTTVAEFKQFLADQYAAGTPVIVVYPLATPKTESVAGQTLQVQAGDNVLEITQASLSGLELEAKYTKMG